MIHVLIVGAGTMGSVHAQAYAKMELVRLVGIVDIRSEQAEQLSAQVNTDAYPSLEDALAAVEKIDVVDVCLPTYLHSEYVKRAADAGKHVICEKPLARHLEEARQMIDYCRQKKVKLFIGHVLRFFPMYAQAKQIIEANQLGTIGIARLSRTGPFPRAWNHWYAQDEYSGGTPLDLMIHDIDFLRWCFGEVERVYARRVAQRDPQIDYTLITLRFKNGTIAHLEGSWSHEKFSMKFELAGDKGIIDYDSAKDQPLSFHQRTPQQGNHGVAVPQSPLSENGYERELRHFIDCLTHGMEPIVTAEDGYEAMRIALAALASADTGVPIMMNNEGQEDWA